MAVPAYQRKEANRAFLVNAEKLQQITNEIVMNEKYVPKKYRFVWTQKVFGLAMDIFENVRRANILYPKTESELKKRLFYLVEAETDAEALCSQISFARNNFNIPSGLLKEWEKTCINTKNTIRRRRNGDFEAYLEKAKRENKS